MSGSTENHAMSAPLVLEAAGAEAVALPPNTLRLVADAAVPLLDTTALHCAALADIIVSGARP